MIGDADDWTPVKDCERWMARRAGRGAPVKFIVYPGVYHSLDSKIAGDGLTLFGHRLKYDPDATRSAGAELQEFLRLELAK
jgi:dienelactone hydrolase